MSITELFPLSRPPAPLPAALACGAGIGPTRIDSVVGICKAYTTRVGAGPFMTELNDEIGERIQKVGGEFGATTGRRRRCGWLDMVLIRQSVRVSGISGLAITKLDVLAGIEKLKDLHGISGWRGTSSRGRSVKQQDTGAVRAGL